MTTTAPTNGNGKGAQGKITQVIGPVVDVEFPTGELPEVYTALKIKNPNVDQTDSARDLTVEVAQHLGEHTVRTIAMDSTDGLVRGMEVIDTKAPIMMPVGNEVLGRILNVVGDPVDERGPVKTKLTSEGHQVEAYHSGQGAFELAKRIKPEIAILDIMLPEVTGYQICRRIRKDPELYRMAILILTALVSVTYTSLNSTRHAATTSGELRR